MVSTYHYDWIKYLDGNTDGDYLFTSDISTNIIDFGLSKDVSSSNPESRILYTNNNISTYASGGTIYNETIMMPDETFICNKSGLYTIAVGVFDAHTDCESYASVALYVNYNKVEPFVDLTEDYRHYYSNRDILSQVYHLGLKQDDVLIIRHEGYTYNLSDGTSTSHDNEYVRLYCNNQSWSKDQTFSWNHSVGVVAWNYALTYDDNRVMTYTATNASGNFEVIS